MKKEIFIKLIKDFWERFSPEYIPRNKKFNFLNVRKVYTIIWPRRAGKTFYCYQIIDQLLKSWVKKQNILYLYLERSELYPLQLQDLDILLETFLELVNYDVGQQYFLFLDEVQVIEWWQKFATKIYNDYPNINLIVTWSTSDLFSSQIASWLRWKATNFEILPLDFEEVLKFKWEKYEKYLSSIKLIRYKQILDEILIWGVFPEIVKLDSIDDKIKILEDYLEITLFKDVIERFNLKSIKKIRYFLKLILSYMWNFINLKKISQIVNADYNSVLNWMDYFFQAYLWFEVKNFDFSIWKQERSQSKIYILDNGYYSINFYHYKQDFGKLFENWVFMEFKKMWYQENKSLFYFKDKKFDIDFVLIDWKRVKFIQIVYELNEDNYQREIGQLIKAKEKYWVDVYLIYKDNFVKKEIKEIQMIPFYRLKDIMR